MSKLVTVYKENPYLPLVPIASLDKEMVFKFNSPQHYFSYVEKLDENFKRGSEHTASDKDEYDFSLSVNLKDAFRVLREVKFEHDQAHKIEGKLSQLKKNTEYSDDGYELEIPEYLAGSDKIWLSNKNKKRPTRIIDDVLLIDGTYSARYGAENSRKIGLGILNSIYNRNLIPRKLVIAFCGKNICRNKPIPKGEYLTTVDVSFNDLNGIAKMLHPSAFRRLWFRIAEQYPDLEYGYGTPRHGDDGMTIKGYIGMNTLQDIFNDKNRFEAEIDKFIGLI